MMANATMKVKVLVLADSHLRRNDKGEYCHTVVYDSTNSAVKQMYFPVKLRDAICKDRFYQIQSVSVGEVVRLNDSSRVFQCGKFAVKEGIVQEYMNPPEKSVEEALLTPVKRQVSVKGILKRCSDVIESPNSKRKELTLESLEGTSSVVCKLWGDCAGVDVPSLETVVTATNMEVSMWKGEVSLNSSVLTSLKETEEESMFEGEIEGIEISENFSYIIICGRTLKVRTDVVEALFQGRDYREDVHVKGTTKGMTVVDIQQFNPAKKVKTE